MLPRFGLENESSHIGKVFVTYSAFLEYCTCEQRIEPNRKSKTRSEDWFLVERWLAVLANCNYTSKLEYFSQRHKMLSLSSRSSMHSVDVASLSRPKQSASPRHKNRTEIGVLCVNESPIQDAMLFGADTRAIRYNADIALLPLPSPSLPSRVARARFPFSLSSTCHADYYN